MIEKIYWILEILAVLICLSSLNGRKLKINLYDAVFIAGDILLMQLIHDGIISRQVIFLIYLWCIVYAYCYLYIVCIVLRESLLWMREYLL